MYISKCAMLILCTLVASTVRAENIGTPISNSDLSSWDISIGPDGEGLPEGSGTVSGGETVYMQQCAACHGVTGTEGPADPLVGGHGTLISDAPVKTVGSYWPYATTLFDYVRRAMPYYSPGSLKDDDVYAVTAYLLNLNGIIDDSAELNAQSLPLVQMPNKDGFISWWPDKP